MNEPSINAEKEFSDYALDWLRRNSDRYKIVMCVSPSCRRMWTRKLLSGKRCGSTDKYLIEREICHLNKFTTLLYLMFIEMGENFDSLSLLSRCINLNLLTVCRYIYMEQRTNSSDGYASGNIIPLSVLYYWGKGRLHLLDTPHKSSKMSAT